MNDWYFYQEKGATVGPIGLPELRELIRLGRVRVFDLIYRDGDPEWRLALAFESLRGDFQSGLISSLRDKPWICLQQKPNSDSGLNFVTTGPYRAEEIQQKLQLGEVKYSDYAWKDGLLGWTRIGALEEFNSRLRAAEKKAENSTPLAKELLEQVVEMRRPTAVREEAPPKGSVGPDLTKSPPVMPSVTKRIPKVPFEMEATVVAPLPNVGRRRRRLQADWGMLGVFGILIVAGFWVISQVVLPAYRMAKSAKEDPYSIAPPPVAEVPPVPASPPEPIPREEKAEAKEKSEAVRPEPREPTQLVLKVQMLGPNQAQIEVRTNGTAEFPVYLQVIGLPGQVSEGGSFYRFSRYTPTGDLKKSLDLSGLKFPQGKFILRAETGKVKKETRLNLGVSDPNYKKAVLQQRKMWAHAIWKERLALLKLSQELEEKVALANGAEKKFSTKGLSQLTSFKRVNGARYFIFESWSELHQITMAAQKEVTTELLARAQKERNRLAGFSVWK